MIFRHLWSEGGGLVGTGIAAGTYHECEEKEKSLGLRPVAEKPGGMSRKSLVVPVTILRAPDGTEERCEARAERAVFELPGGGNAYLAHAAKAERDCIERLKRQGYKLVWVFDAVAVPNASVSVSARYSRRLRIPSVECGAWLL